MDKNCKLCKAPLFETVGGKWRHKDGRDYWGVFCPPCGWSWTLERVENFRKDNPGKKIRCGKCKCDRDLVYGHQAVVAESEAASAR